MDIQQLCKSFLENMNVASKVGLELRSDLSISELRADFWVISSNGFPVGAIEVKKPDGEDSNEETRKMHLGQLFDYLMRIRTFHGVRNLIGILTDFESWTICWPKDSEQLGKATDDIDPGNAINPTTPGSREIYVSRAYRAQENTLAYAIVSALRKMKSSGERVDHVDLLSSSRSYIQLTGETWLWKSNLKATQLKMEPPARNTKVFYLLRDYHDGSDGRVWLACSQNGNLSVIKFLKREQGTSVHVNDTALAQKELKYWKRCGFPQVFVTKLARRSALILPFGFHYRDSDAKIDDHWWISSNEPVQCSEHYNSVLSLVKNEDASAVLEACVEL